jgi:hypothetical protein
MGRQAKSPPKDPKEIEYEKFKDECTFQPNSKKKQILANNAQVKGKKRQAMKEKKAPQS